jgi:hypothetical protein
MKQITHEYLVENGLILLRQLLVHTYGTQTPSDIDKKNSFIFYLLTIF